MKKLLIVSAILSAAFLAGCDEVHPNSDQIQRKQQEQLSLQGAQAVGMPAISAFAEKRMMKDLLELRDQNVATTTYTQDMNGVNHRLCNSIGFGLPYSTQYTNPQRVATYSEGGHYATVTIPQADPNGLFSPASAEGTWIMCVPKGKTTPVPVYSEPRVIVSPVPLDQF